MAKGATSGELRNGFTEHLEQTRGHVDRLEQIFEALGERPSGKKCDGMEGLNEEGSEAIDENFEDNVMDAALVSAAQRVEQAKIAAYDIVCAFAELFAESKHLSLLRQTLDEEKQADAKLNELSKKINTAAHDQPLEPASGSLSQGRAA